MSEILNNKWVKWCMSIFCTAYFALIIMLTYATFIYKLEFVDGMKAPFLFLYGIASMVFLVLAIMTRDIILTRLMSVLFMPVVFMLILLNMYNWVLIVPPFAVALILFFVAGTSEHVKVILGTVYLLMYVLGIVAYFVLNMLLSGTAVETELNLNLDPEGDVFPIYATQLRKINEVTDEANCISPDGKYMFYICDVSDSDKGAVKIYVVPANQDIKLKFFTLRQQGIRKTITKNGTRGVVPSVGWIVEQDTPDSDPYLSVMYQLTDDDPPKIMKIRNMPAKNYWGFLGIS